MADVSVEPGEICCLTTTLNFVDAVMGAVWASAEGRTVVLILEEVVKDFGPLVETLASHRVSRFVLVPSLLDALARERAQASATVAPVSRLWTSSGEALSVDLVRRFPGPPCRGRV